MLEALARKWRRETGTEPTLARLVKAERFLKRLGLQPGQARFEMHVDPIWNTRPIREEHESLAACVGYTNARNGHTRWWVVPKKSANAA